MNFYKTYKKLSLIAQGNELLKVEHSPNVAYLKQLRQKRLSPQALGIIRRKGSPHDYQLKGLGMGDQYAKAFSHGLRQTESVRTLNLKSNRLTEAGTYNILKHLPLASLSSIDLSNNRLGCQSVSRILQILGDKSIRLKVLSLENTSLTSNDAVRIVEEIEAHSYLDRLNLSRNKLSGVAVHAIGTMLRHNSSLKYLDMHWNQIRSDSGIHFFSCLSMNDSLLHVDLS